MGMGAKRKKSPRHTQVSGVSNFLPRAVQQFLMQWCASQLLSCSAENYNNAYLSNSIHGFQTHHKFVN